MLFCYKYFLHVSHCLEIGSLRYDAASRRALDGVQLLCSLLVDSITSPYIDGSGEDDPLQIGSARLQTKRTTSFKPHLCRLQRPQCITPLRDVECQSPAPARPQDQIRGELADQMGVLTRRGQRNLRHSQRRPSDALNGSRFITRESGQGAGLDGSCL